MQSSVDHLTVRDSLGRVTTVRPATLQDLPGVYRVCLQTGDSGNDATSQYRNPDLLGHVFVGPYLVGDPRHAFVLADRESVAGYTFAVEDTLAFEEWERTSWWPILREQYPLIPQGTGELTENDEALIRLIHQPKSAPEDVVEDYPAHLHIDLLPRALGQGFGRHLMELIIERLRGREVRGVHLGVGPENSNAIAFYKHLGFTVLREESDDIYMGMRLT